MKKQNGGWITIIIVWLPIIIILLVFLLFVFLGISEIVDPIDWDNWLDTDPL